MSHQQPSPENNPAYTSHEFHLEQLPPSPDSASAADLAHAIVNDNPDIYTSPDNGFSWLRDSWDSTDGLLTFHLFESYQNNDFRYTLDINEAGVFSSYSYAFSQLDPTPVLNIRRSDATYEEALPPEQITHYLRERYQQTTQYLQDQQAFKRFFTESMARAAAEYALGHRAEFGSGKTFAKELQASDPVVRERARNGLYNIAQLSGLIEDQALFDIALQVTIDEQKETSVVAGIDELVRTRQTPPKRLFRFIRK